jgi:biotin transporter BioY
MEHGRKSFARAALGGLLGEVVLFASGLAWLAVLTHSVVQAFRWGLYWFLFAEIIKVMMAAGIAARWQRRSDAQLERQR